MEKKTRSPKTPEAEANEKRRGSRMRLACPVTFQKVTDAGLHGKPEATTSLDISTSGILIRTEHPLELTERYRVQIRLPGVESLLNAQAQVVRVEEKEAGRSYLAGFRFDKLEPPEPLEFLKRLETLNLRRVLDALVSSGASDLHLTTGSQPIGRVRGHLKPLNHPAFQPNEIRALVYSVMTETQISEFERDLEIDLSYALSPKERFRFNLHWQRGQVEATIRIIPPEVVPPEKLGIPEPVVEWTRRPHGLILVVGSARTGKTTTLNSLVDAVNRNRDAVIICLERPIEYVHQNQKSVIKQREVGADTRSFAEAMRRALRQDPDIILVGEVEDAETAQIALNASESGNLVLASLHAASVVQAIDRLLNLCPPQLRHQISFQLANSLVGILSQHLLPREDAMGGGMILATELFVPTDAGRSAIRNSELTQLPSIIETGGGHKMHTLERSVRQLFETGQIAEETMKAYLTAATPKK